MKKDRQPVYSPRSEYVQTPIEKERQRRIKVTAWAYAYEYESLSIVDDGTYDRESRLIDPSVKTGNDKLDKFFRTKFNPQHQYVGT